LNRWDIVNGVLALAVGALLALLWLPIVGPTTPVMLDIEPGGVTRVRVERGDRLVLELERHGDDWRLTYPAPAAANPAEVNRLLATARAPIALRITPAEGADYGLTPGSLVLQFDQRRVTFGARDPTQRYRYVAVDGDIAAVDETYYQLAGLPASHYRVE
jgi:hypothetical protein